MMGHSETLFLEHILKNRKGEKEDISWVCWLLDLIILVHFNQKL